MAGVFHRFGRNRAGNFAILSALLAVPLMLSAGVALDLSNIARTKAELQNALDSAALAIAREGNDIDDAQAHRIAMTFVETNYHLRFTNLEVKRSGTSVSVNATTRATMAFGGLLGYDEWPVATAASADIAFASYEIALVLDTTGSMAGGKLSAMKNAVDGMIDSMSAQIRDRSKLRFALVPFATFVNVGPQYGPSFDKDGLQVPGTGARWLDLEGRSPIQQLELAPGASRFQAYHNMGLTWPGCVETRPAGGANAYDVSNAPANPSRPESLFVPVFAIDEPDGSDYRNSYIASTASPFDKSVSARKARHAKYGLPTDSGGNPLTGAALKAALGFPGLGGGVAIDRSAGHHGYMKGPDFGCGTQPITPLTNDYKTVRDKVKSLNAQGTTNIMEGVAWGNRVLTPGEPFNQAHPKGSLGVEKIMIVLSDGANVMGNASNDLGSQYSSFGYLVEGRLGLSAGGASATNQAMNTRTLAACEQAKANGIVVYTIRLEEPDVKTGQMLSDCASSPAHYFDAPSRSQLDDVFQTIRDRIVRIRISS